MSVVGLKIMQRRKELGMTQEELATRMGYKSKSTINKIELGINDIVQSKVVKFAEVLETTPAYIMGWLDEEKPTEDDRLSENMKQLIDFVKTIPEDKVELVLKLMRTIVEDD